MHRPCVVRNQVNWGVNRRPAPLTTIHLRNSSRPQNMPPLPRNLCRRQREFTPHQLKVQKRTAGTTKENPQLTDGVEGRKGKEKRTRSRAVEMTTRSVFIQLLILDSPHTTNGPKKPDPRVQSKNHYSKSGPPKVQFYRFRAAPPHNGNFFLDSSLILGIALGFSWVCNNAFSPGMPGGVGVGTGKEAGEGNAKKKKREGGMFPRGTGLYFLFF